MNKKIKYWLTENWMLVLPSGIFIVYLCIIFFVLNSGGAQTWFKKPLDKFTTGDLLILVLVHAWISKSVNKCNCKSDDK